MYRRLGASAAGAGAGQTGCRGLNPGSRIPPAAAPAGPRLGRVRVCVGGGGGRPRSPPQGRLGRLSPQGGGGQGVPLGSSWSDSEEAGTGRGSNKEKDFSLPSSVPNLHLFATEQTRRGPPIPAERGKEGEHGKSEGERREVGHRPLQSTLRNSHPTPTPRALTLPSARTSRLPSAWRGESKELLIGGGEEKKAQGGNVKAGVAALRPGAHLGWQPCHSARCSRAAGDGAPWRPWTSLLHGESPPRSESSAALGSEPLTVQQPQDVSRV